MSDSEGTGDRYQVLVAVMVMMDASNKHIRFQDRTNVRQKVAIEGQTSTVITAHLTVLYRYTYTGTSSFKICDWTVSSKQSTMPTFLRQLWV